MTAPSNGGPLLKICGIKEESTLLEMEGLPVDYIGLVFADSRRQVSAERAAQLVEAVRSRQMANGKPPLIAGVFVEPTLTELDALLAEVPLDIVQFHGKSETPEFCREVKERFGVEVWRALPADEADIEQEITDSESSRVQIKDSNEVADQTGPGRLADYAGVVSAVLIDTAGGGTGRTFRWSLIPVYQAAARDAGLRLFVAGGLHQGNVEELLAEYAPDGVDISSGVETDGVKDSAKIAAFTERVKNRL